MAELIQSRKGNFLHIEGYLYYGPSGAGRRYWQCRQKGSCNARAITTGDGENLVVHKGPKQSPHTNHAPNYKEVAAVRAVATMKRIADNHPQMPPSQIIRKEMRGMPEEVLAEMPDRVNLAKQLSRAKLKNMSPNPMRIQDLPEIPVKYQQTLGGSKFLIYDSLDDEGSDDDSEFGNEEEDGAGRILIFATAENLTQLCRCNTWFVDGTFKTSPSLFYQLFSILGALHQVGVNRKPQIVGLPFVHALLQNKRQVAYTKVLKVVLEKIRELKLSVPENLKIMSDFEYGCCFFHLCQNVYKHIQDEGLQRLYNGEDRRIKRSVHALCALAFVPHDEVVTHFRQIRDELPEQLEPVVDYFETNYVRKLVVRKRKNQQGIPGVRLVTHPPRFPPALWSQYNAVLDETARTNNVSEGWHNRFQLVIGKHHPSMYAFLDELQKEQADTEIMLRQLQLGQRIRKGTDKKRRKLEELILNVVATYHRHVLENDILNYLTTVGYHVKF